MLREGATKTCRLRRLFPLTDLLLYAVSLENKKTSPPPLVVLVNKSKKIKKIVAQWVPSSVPFGDCEKRTVTRFALSFAFRLISLAQGLPFSTIYAFAFLFFSSPSDWQKIFSSPVKIFLSHFAHFFCHAKNYFKTSKQKDTPPIAEYLPV